MAASSLNPTLHPRSLPKVPDPAASVQVHPSVSLLMIYSKSSYVRPPAPLSKQLTLSPEAHIDDAGFPGLFPIECCNLSADERGIIGRDPGWRGMECGVNIGNSARSIPSVYSIHMHPHTYGHTDRQTDRHTYIYTAKMQAALKLHKLP